MLYSPFMRTSCNPSAAIAAAFAIFVPTIAAHAQCPQATINVLILTDSAPEETTWELREQASGSLVSSGGPYPGQPDTLISFNVCVATASCHDWTIFDSGGNGIPGGGYEISLNGTVVGDSGSFGGAEESVVNIGAGCIGACCLGNGTCQESLLASACEVLGGHFQGTGVSCAGAGCTPFGACCQADGSCAIDEMIPCLASGGAYQGDAVMCSPNPCPLPTGACCLLTGCAIETAPDCTAATGAYQGDDTTCAPDPCPQPCPGGTSTIRVLILTDGAPQETTWEVRDQVGNALVGSGGPYTGQPNQYVVANVCVDPTHCYGWTIFDSGGNGLAGGGYQIRLNGNIIASNGAFADGQETVPNIGTCSGATGRCCHADGACTVVTAAACATAGGTYDGDGTTCTPNVCPQPEGACCISGTCAIENPTECAAAGGAYEGDDTSCTPNPCPCPQDTINVLILTDFAPEETMWELRDQSDDSLVASGGPYPGLIDQFVPTNICVDETGCYGWTIFDSGGNGLDGGGYQISLNGDIVATNGNFPDDEETVPDIGSGCSGVTGACCFPGGSCTVVTGAACAAADGAYEGDGTTCSPNPCPQPTGACCAGGACSIETAASCATASGAYQGDGTSCSPNPCPQPTGACCVGNTCSIETAASCATASGTYQGNGTTCSPNPCLCPGMDTITIVILTDSAPEETTWELRDQSDDSLVESGGPYTGQPGALITTNVCVDPADCFDWTIFDAGANGTAGGYEISLNGVILAENGAFAGAQETVADIGTICSAGACCFTDGSCVLAGAIACVAAGGAYEGNATTCAPNPCPQPPGACCFTGGLCADGVTMTLCDDAGGIFQGGATQCATASCPALRVLFVVTNSGAPTVQEQARIAFLTAEGYTVTLLTSNSVQAAYDAAIAQADVAYASEELVSTDVGTKLTAAPIGVVNEESALYDELGISMQANVASRSSIEILDEAHPITSVFALGELAITTSNQPMTMLQGAMADGADVLAQNLALDGILDLPALTAVETGAAIIGGTAAGRRVMLPWGSGEFALAALNADGQTILLRSLDWAGGALDETGACCFADGSCADDLGEIECGLVESGSWHGPASTCASANCPVPPGACCLADGSCQDVADATACAAVLGDFEGPGTTCASTVCPVLPGACCLADGSCQLVADAAACTALAGVFTTPGSACASANCPILPGACCIANGSCQDVANATACAALPGDFEGHGTTCAGTTCPVLPGACCIEGDCELAADEAACLTEGGLFQGPASLCATVECEAPCPADFNGDGQVGFGDLSGLLIHWAPFPNGQQPWDINGNQDVGFADLVALLLTWGLCP